MEKTDVLSNFEAEYQTPGWENFLDGRLYSHGPREDGKLLFFEGSLIDITERKQAEKGSNASLSIFPPCVRSTG